MKEISPKEKIIKTTKKMIEEYGYNNLNVNRIAEEAGVAIGTLYWHFKKGKPSILKEMMKKSYSSFLDDSLMNKITRDNFPVVLREILEIYLKQHKRNVPLIKAMEMALLENPEIFQDIEFVKTELRLIPLISKMILKAKKMRKNQADDLAALFLKSIDAIVHQHVIYGDIVEDDDLLIKFLTNVILRYLKID